MWGKGNKAEDYEGRDVRVRHNGAVIPGRIAKADRTYNAHDGSWSWLFRVAASFPGGRGGQRDYNEHEVTFTD